MNDWNGLSRELDAWTEDGRQATFWWRDDDATEWTPKLNRLLELAAAHGVPIALAVIPGAMKSDLRENVGEREAFAVLQHGYAHRNHALPREKKCELGHHRPADEVLAEIRAGRERLETVFGRNFVPVLVPPWNRIEKLLLPHLSLAGFAGLSTYGPREREWPAKHIRQVNTHVDPIDWRGSRGFLGEAKVLALVIGRLRARRCGEVDTHEPTGILTHHLVHDDGCWRFLSRLLARTAAHPGVAWLGAPEIFS